MSVRTVAATPTASGDQAGPAVPSIGAAAKARALEGRRAPIGERAPTNLSLPRDLVAEVDELAGPRGRSAFVEEAVRRALRRERLRLAIERTAGAWKGRGPAIWDEPDGVARWVRELRAEETDPGPEA